MSASTGRKSGSSDLKLIERALPFTRTVGLSKADAILGRGAAQRQHPRVLRAVRAGAIVGLALERPTVRVKGVTRSILIDFRTEDADTGHLRKIRSWQMSLPASDPMSL